MTTRVLVPVLGIVWHPEPARIGGVASLHFTGAAAVEVSRLVPSFRTAVANTGAPLGDRHLSRSPVQLVRLGQRRFRIIPCRSRMQMTVNGQVVVEPVVRDLDDLGEEILIGLGRTVLLALFLRPADAGFAHGSSLAGISGVIAAVRRRIARAAPTDTSVLIRGETGAGKELAARDLHGLSGRSGKALISLNMATMSAALAPAELFGVKKGAFTGADSDRPGAFEQADGGTLFLDEIGATPAETQPMLLRALETGEVRRLGDQRGRRINVRIVAATDARLEHDSGHGGFNQPLLQRLEEFVITIPPLRRRRADIGILILELMSRIECPAVSGVQAVTFDMVTRMALHSWPGNVRELRNKIVALTLGEDPFDVVAGRGDNGRPITPRRALYRDHDTIGEAELLKALDRSGWRIKPAAEMLNISRTSLYRLIAASQYIRMPDAIPEEEVRAAAEKTSGDFSEMCRHLRTPRDALKRHLRDLKMIS